MILTELYDLVLFLLCWVRYYINMPGDATRRQLLESWWGSLWDLRRHEGVNATKREIRTAYLGEAHHQQVIQRLKAGALIRLEEFNQTQGFDTDEYMRQRLLEVGVCLAHLTAIRRAYDEAQGVAMIIEDDLTPFLVPYWRWSLREVVALMDHEEPSWYILQLTHIDRGVAVTQELVADGLFERRPFCFGAAAYVISRAGMEYIISKYFDGALVRLPLDQPIMVIDSTILNTVPNTYVASTPLFTTNFDLPSTIGSVVTYHADAQKMHWARAASNLERDPLHHFTVEEEGHPEGQRDGMEGSSRTMAKLFPNLQGLNLAIDFPV